MNSWLPLLGHQRSRGGMGAVGVVVFPLGALLGVLLARRPLAPTVSMPRSTIVLLPEPVCCCFCACASPCERNSGKRIRAVKPRAMPGAQQHLANTTANPLPSRSFRHYRASEEAQFEGRRPKVGFTAIALGPG